MSSYTLRLTVLALVALPFTGCGGANPYQDMGEDELFAIGTKEFADGRWGAAISALDRIMVMNGSSALGADVRLLMADAYFNKGDLLTARSEYQRFLDRYSANTKAPVAALGVCRSLAALSPDPVRDQAYTNDAIAICRNVVVDYAGSPESLVAAQISNEMRLKLAEKEYLAADFYFRRKLYDSAIKYYEFVVQLYPETEWAPESLKGIYWSNIYIGYEDIAEETKARLLAEYPDSPAAKELGGDAPGS